MKWTAAPIMGIPNTLIKTGGILLILALSITAGSQAAAEDPPGNNGTVKIHDGDSEAEPIRRNEPHVGCTFHIHGFNFDASSTGTWNVQSWPPTGDRSVVASGTWGAADAKGDWRTAVTSLPSGHYKLNVDQTSPSAPGAEKHKVFWVECAPIAPIGSVGTPPTVVTGAITILQIATAVPTIEAIVLVGGSVIPPNSVIILPSAIVLPNGVDLAAGEIQPGTLLPAGTALPAGTTFRVLGVLGTETAPVSVPAVKTVPAVKGIQALPSTSTN